MVTEFQSTPPRGGRLITNKTSNDWTSFNPRPRAGGDDTEFNLMADKLNVSIHAPARGATGECLDRKSVV